MKSPKELLERFRRGPSELVGIDLTPMAAVAVRMRKGNDGLTLVAGDVLPPIALDAGNSEETLLALPARLRARHAVLTVPGDKAVVRLLSFPGRAETGLDEKIVDSLGLESPDDYRIGYKTLGDGGGRGETRAVAVALPDAEAGAAAALLPTGLPVPLSLEVSSLATMTAFMHGPAFLNGDKAVGLINFGATNSLFGLFANGNLLLIRRFERGADQVLRQVQEALGVDMATAVGILSEGSFDVSQSVMDVMEPLIKQLIVSRDFVERRENCRIGRLYVAGSLSMSRDVHNEMQRALGLDVEAWNPLEGVTVLPDAIPNGADGREWVFAAAVGACQGAMEEL